ncbi:hypothetical protein R6Q57_008462, partial [Mikania cordata]
TLNDTGLRGKNEERSAGRSTEWSTLSRKSPFIPKTDFENRVHSTITKEAGSKLNPISEPFVPTWSLEHASSNTSSSHGDRDVKPFDPIEFHEKGDTSESFHSQEGETS